METVNEYLISLLEDLSIRESRIEEIQCSFDSLKGELWRKFQDRLEKVEMFGSYDRGTSLPQAIDPQTDVDVLIQFKTADFQPQTFLEHLRQFAKSKYSRSGVEPSFPAIVVELHHVTFELVPSFSQLEKTGIFSEELRMKIPAPRSNEDRWITTNPAGLKEAVEEKDAEHHQLIIPLIKLIKYLNCIHNRPYDSFIIEGHIIQVDFDDCSPSLPDFVLCFIESLRDLEEATEHQRKFIQTLRRHRKNLRTLIKENMSDYALQEAQKLFMPVETWKEVLRSQTPQTIPVS